MSLVLIPVKVTAKRADNTPVVGATVRAALTVAESDDGLVVPGNIVGTTDGAGQVTLNLWPNSRGINGSQYRVVIEGDSLYFSGLVTIPEAPNSAWPIALETLINQPPYPARSVAELAQAKAQEYMNEAKGARDQAVPAATAATEQVSLANTARGGAETARDAAIAARDAAILARDASFALGPKYATEALGRAAVADGATFLVQGSGDVAAFEYRRTSSSVSALIASYPAVAYVEGIADDLRGLQWRDPAAAAVTDPVERTVASAIKAVVGVGFSGAARNKLFRFTVVTKNHVSLFDRVYIADEAAAVWGFDGTAPGKADGPVWVKTGTNGSTGAAYFWILIDFRGLADGIALNTNSTRFLLSGNIFRDEKAQEQLDALQATTWLWRDSTSTALATPAEESVRAAIMKVDAVGMDTTKTYKVVTFCKDDAGVKDNMIIQRSDGLQWSYGANTVPNKANGPVWLRLVRTGEAGYFNVQVDYRKVTTTGVIFNGGASDKYKLSTIIFDNDALRAEVKDYAAIAAARWRDSTDSLSATEMTIRDAILKIDGAGVDRTDSYRMITFCKADSTFGEQIIIANLAGTKQWSTGSGATAGRDTGPVWVKAVRGVNDPSYFNLLVDFRKVTATGVLYNSGSSNKFKLSSAIHENDKLRDEIAAAQGQAQLAPLARAIRLSLAGSSITWGDGWLGQNTYVGLVEQYLRHTLASTKHGTDFITSGTASTVNNNLFYKGSATLLSGIGADATVTMTGDEFSVCIARERGNVGAARVELYVDDVLHDTFTTHNPEPYTTANAFYFVGDGSTVKFDLGKAFTFNHVLTVAGAPKVVQMNTAGYGASIPGGVDALVIRKIVSVGGVPEVHHFLWFAAAPANGAVVDGTYDCGESVTYVKSTVGQTTRPLSGTNETPYGDGAVSLDPASPSNISSGLGFRESDPRSVLTWTFGSSATRKYRLRVASLDPRGTGTPQLYLNFATNRMHHIQNAGIGGWTAGLLLTDAGLNNLAEVAKFQPDVFLLESATNDDWSARVNRAWRTRTNMPDAFVRAEAASYFNAITYVGPDNYTVEDTRIPITAITATYAELSGTGATFNVQAGDVITFGDFKGDNRRIASRVVSNWNAGTRRVTWAKPLRVAELAHVKTLGDLVGTTAVIKGMPTWVANVEAIIDGIRAAVPRVQIGIGTSGIPNIRYRRLEGYFEAAQAIAGRKDCHVVDFHGSTLRWQFSQPRSTQKYLNASQSTTSTGAASYKLYNADGSPFTAAVGNQNLQRHFSVLVDGVERINDGCHVAGGPKTGWLAATSPMTLLNTAVVSDDYELVFTANVPAASATIVVKHAAAKWSTDDCHPAAAGFGPMSQAPIAVLEHAAKAAAAA